MSSIAACSLMARKPWNFSHRRVAVNESGWIEMGFGPTLISVPLRASYNV